MPLGPSTVGRPMYGEVGMWLGGVAGCRRPRGGEKSEAVSFAGCEEKPCKMEDEGGRGPIM